MPVVANTPFVLSQSVSDLLKDSSLENITCQCAGSTIVLRGQVPNLRHKRRASELARRICGMGEISNEIDVN